MNDVRPYADLIDALTTASCGHGLHHDRELLATAAKAIETLQDQLAIPMPTRETPDVDDVIEDYGDDPGDPELPGDVGSGPSTPTTMGDLTGDDPSDL